MATNRVRNPYDGKRGWGNALNRLLFPIIGPAHLGAGAQPSEPPAPRPPALCPSCGIPYAEHRIHRGEGPSQSTSLLCPR